MNRILYRTEFLLLCAFVGWSAQRGPNKGLRLDYFLCSPALFEESAPVVVHDVWHDVKSTKGVSDHCPIGLTLRLKEEGASA